MKYLILIMICFAVVLCGCEDTNLRLATEAGLDAVRAVTLSDEDVRLLATRAAAESDRQHTLARSGSGYERRLSQLTRKMNRVNGRTYDIRAYLSPKVNAFAMADGTIRIYTGLMDRMDDLELLFVIGHEMGHVAENHSKKKLMMAYAARALRKGVASQENIAGLIAGSALGGFVEALANAQYSQKEEKAADEFGLLFLEQTGIPRQRAAKSAAAALDKLASPDVDHTILSSHPEPAKRAARIRTLAGQAGNRSADRTQDTAKHLSLTDRVMATLDRWISR